MCERWGGEGMGVCLVVVVVGVGGGVRCMQMCEQLREKDQQVNNHKHTIQNNQNNYILNSQYLK